MTTYNNLIKIYCSPFGFQYITQKYDFTNFINEHIEEMEKLGFKLKLRTFLPIFNICFQKDFQKMLIETYLACKVRGIKINSNILVNMTRIQEPMIRSSIFYDFVQTDDKFKEEDIKVLQSIFPKNKIGTIRGNCIMYSDGSKSKTIEPFRMELEYLNKILDTIRSHVQSITRNRKSNWDYYNEFIKYIKRIDYKFVIDGANIGRLEQGTKSNKDLNFKQIRLIVEKCVSSMPVSKQEKNIIVILNENHLKKISYVDREHIDYLRENTIIYETPRGIDDDLFGLYAAVFKQDAYLVTTDELRNHIHTINGNFLQWKKYNRITVTFNKQKTKVTLNKPLSYVVKPFMNHKEGILSVPINELEWISFKVK